MWKLNQMRSGEGLKKKEQMDRGTERWKERGKRRKGFIGFSLFLPGAHSSTENTSPLALVKVTPGLPPLCWHSTGVSLRNSLGHSCPPTGVCGSCWGFSSPTRSAWTAKDQQVRKCQNAAHVYCLIDLDWQTLHPNVADRPTSVPVAPLPPASTTASIFSSSTMATLSSVFLKFSCSFLMSSRKRFSLVGFSGAVGVTEAATWAVEAGSAEVGEVGEPPVHSCSTVMFFRLSSIFKASFNSLKPREAPSLLGFSAPLTAPGVVPMVSRQNL